MSNTYVNLNAELNLYSPEGKLQLEKDHEAARAYFLEHVNVNTRFFHDIEEKIEYLTSNDFWDKNTLDAYDPEFVKKAFKHAYDKKFRFPSFMGAYKFYTSYALKSNDGKTILERYEDRVVMCALHLGRGDKKLAISLIDEMISGRYQPATPTFQNAGKSRGGELVSCFLLNTSDSLDSIQSTWNYSAQLSKIGGGVAICLTNLRERGAPLKGKDGLAKGVISWMKIYEDIFSTVDQLGTRPGAGAVYLSVHHPDIIEFLDCKRENADEKMRIKTLSTGIVIPDITFELAKNNEDMYLFSPYDVQKEYKMPFSEINITEKYHEMVDNPNISKKKTNARKLLQLIAELQFESGYPYMLFADTANRANPVQGTISMSNLCVAGDTSILTDGGYRKVEDLYRSQEDFDVVVDKRARDLDLSCRGVSQEKSTRMFKTAENADIYKISTHEGFQLRATAWHKMYVVRDGELIKIPLVEVEVGDKLLVQDQHGNERNVSENGFAVVQSIVRDGVEDVYDVTVENGHSVIFNGIATGNCSEILQTSTPTVFDDATGEIIDAGRDISCNLGSLNVYNAMQSPDFAKTIDTSMRALTAVSDMTDIHRVPTVKKANDQMHSVGLGAMSLATFFATHEMYYGDEESLDFTNNYFMTVNYHTLLTSCKIAQERKATFEGFKESKYYDGTYFDQYLSGDEIKPQTEKVRKIFENSSVHVPTQEDWQDLKEKVHKHGLWHAWRMATAPTGSISYINYASPSILPVTSLIEIRKEGALGRVYAPAPHLNEENKKYYIDAYQAGPEKIIDVYAEATKHSDQGLSCTLHFLETATTRDLNKAQLYAWRKGLKTLYYSRFRNVDSFGGKLNVEECVSCSI